MWGTTPDGLLRPAPLPVVRQARGVDAPDDPSEARKVDAPDDPSEARVVDACGDPSEARTVDARRDPNEARVVDARSDPGEAAAALERGDHLVLGDRFSTGLTILAALKRHLGPAPASHAESRSHRAAFHRASHRLLVPIHDHAIALKKAPSIGWLSRLYPDLTDFQLPFPQVQGLNGSWQWYSKGIQFPVLDHPLFPFFGTYFPTRFEHLALFDEWLRARTGPLASAVDVGTGCGVLTFQLLRRGATRVYATDTNPNAIQSVREDLLRTHLQERVNLSTGDLFAGFAERADLIVLNPPWLPGEVHGPIDAAIYHPADFFERFFRAAAERLSPSGRIVILFSSLRALTEARGPHPIESELEGGGRFVQVQRLQRAVAPASKKTRRPKETRAKERVELWELAGR